MYYCNATCQRIHWKQQHRLECRHKWKHTMTDYMESLQAPVDNAVRRAIETNFAIGLHSRRTVSAAQLSEFLLNSSDLLVMDIPFFDVIDVFAAEFGPWWESAQTTGASCKRTVLTLIMESLPATRDAFANYMEFLSARDDAFWDERNARVPILMIHSHNAVQGNPDLAVYVTTEELYDNIQQLRTLLQRAVNYRAQVAEEIAQLRTFVQYASNTKKK